MKWSVQQLEKLTTSLYEFDYTSDFSEEIKQVEDSTYFEMKEINDYKIREVLKYSKSEVSNAFKTSWI